MNFNSNARHGYTKVKLFYFLALEAFYLYLNLSIFELSETHVIGLTLFRPITLQFSSVQSGFKVDMNLMGNL